MEVTDSKQWIHFFRSERWPPTSNMCILVTGMGRERERQERGHARELAHVESGFCDADALLTDTQDICFVWDIARSAYAEDIVEKACESE